MTKHQSISLFLSTVVGVMSLLGMFVVFWGLALVTGVIGHSWAPEWWRVSFFALALLATPGVAGWLAVSARRSYLRRYAQHALSVGAASPPAEG